MNVVFLDFDGVLTNDRYNKLVREVYGHALPEDEPLEPFAVQAVDRMVHQAQAHVVITTARRWRYHLSLETLTHHLRRKGLTVPVYGLLQNPVQSGPDEPLQEHRGQFIKLWLEDHPEVTQHVVLDDLDESVPGLNWVRTTESKGVTSADLERALAFFHPPQPLKGE